MCKLLLFFPMISYSLNATGMGTLSLVGSTVLGKCWKANFSMLRFMHTSNFQRKLIVSSSNESYCGRYSRRCTSLYMAAGTECRTTSAKLRIPSIGSQVFMYSTDVSIPKSYSRSNNFTSIEIFDAEEGGILVDQNSKHAVRVFVIDIETTGFCRKRGRIIEIAIRDQQGGKNSCFRTLVNPEQVVPNSIIHGITTEMVKQPGVPRMEELIPILLEYIKSRLLPGERPLFVAHKARNFDVPFLLNEFDRNSHHFPSDWVFVDSWLLARNAMKLKGSRGSVSLLALAKHYRITLEGSHHRAMSDVNLLSAIFWRLIQDFNLSVNDLLERSFSAETIKLNSKESRS